MSQAAVSKYFQKSSSFKVNRSSLFVFVFAAFIAWEINIIGQMVFPSHHLIFFLTRITINFICDFALLYVSYTLLKRNNIPFSALGLCLSKSTAINVLAGILIGVMTVLSTACILQLLVPYHFEYRLLSGPRVLSEAFSYLPGAFLEELIFRGFLLVVFSQLLGWRLSLLIIALPFGLFHLQGGNGGYSIVISTTMCSFIFGLSFILTRSMWTSIASHATANIFLHVITGLDGAGTSVYKPVFEQAWPKQYDAGLLCMVAGAIIVTALLYILTLKKINSVNLNA